MAGDWIPMRVDLADDPAVIQIAQQMGLDEFAVVGRLHRLWSWANRHLSSGDAPGVTEQWIDRFLSTAGFAAAMLDAGWLRLRSGTVEFPNFDRWNSQSAKRRVTNTLQKQAKRTAPRVRKMSAPDADKPRTKCGPEKRREEDRRKEKKTPLPPAEPGGGVGAYPALPADGSEDQGVEQLREQRHRPSGGEPTAEARIDAERIAAGGEVIAIPPFSEFVAAWVDAKLLGWNAPSGPRESPTRVNFWQQRFASLWWRANWREAVRLLGLNAGARGEEEWGGIHMDTFLKSEEQATKAIDGIYKPDGAVSATKPAAKDPYAEARVRAAERLRQQREGGTSGG